MQTNYLLDTNVFNRVVKDGLNASDLRGRRTFVTHLQIDELGSTPDPVLRQDLKAILTTSPSARLATEGFVLGTSRLDEAKFGGKDSRYYEILTRLEKLDKQAGKRLKSGAPPIADALILETCRENGLTLVTDDGPLQTIAREMDVSFLSFDDWWGD